MITSTKALVLNVLPGAFRLLVPACAIVFTLAACSRDKTPAPASAAHDSAIVPLAPAPAPANAPDPVGLVPLPEDKASKELASYHLTLPMLRQWAGAQNAVDSATAGNTQMLDAMKKAAPRTLDEMITVIDAQVPIRNALKRHGLTTHDYVLTMIAMNQAIDGYQRKAAGQTLPPNLPPILVENIAFVGQNLAAVQQILAPPKR